MNTSSFVALMGFVVYTSFMVFLLIKFIRDERKK